MRPTRYKYYVLGVLTAISLCNYVDRAGLGLLFESIKADLHLTDTQLGFLSGISFALFYSVMGIPIARWADRGNRVTIIAVTAALWSVAVSACGWVANFTQLLLIRIGVAVGEAGCLPPGFSLLADYFNRAERPRATAIYWLGGPLSLVVVYLLAGWINDLYGWRVTFMVLGAPGLLLAPLAWFTLKEPRRLSAAQRAVFLTDPELSPVSQTQPSLKEVGVTLWTSATFRHLLFCLSVLIFFNYGIGQWLPAFFMRSFGFTTGQIGVWLAIVFGCGALVGTYLSGELSTRFAARNESLQLKVMAAALAASGVLMSLVYLSPNAYLVLAAMTCVCIGLATVNGPLYATLQTLVPERMRALALALIYLVANLIGMGLGPLAVGALSDLFRPWAGEESLRYALLALSPGYFWAAWHAWRAGRTVTRDIAEVLT